MTDRLERVREERDIREDEWRERDGERDIHG